MKYQFLQKILLSSLFIMFNICAKGQQLTIPETIDYINQLIKSDAVYDTGKDNCQRSIYDQVLLSPNGDVTIINYWDVPNCPEKKIAPEVIYIVHHTDLDKNKIDFMDANRLRIYCKGEGLAGVHDGDRCIKFLRFGGGHTDFFELKLNEVYNAKRLKNAFSYLFDLLDETSEYSREDPDDPFAPSNFKRSNVTANSNSKSPKIPLKEIGAVYEIRVQIGGVFYNFILDSGASEIQVNENIINHLLKNGLLGNSDYLAIGLYRIADGSVRSAKRVRLKNIKVGSFSVANLSAVIGESGDPLLLGKNFLDSFKKWQVDNSGPYLILEP